MKILKWILKNLDSLSEQGAQKGKHLIWEIKGVIFVSSKIRWMKGNLHIHVSVSEAK